MDDLEQKIIQLRKLGMIYLSGDDGWYCSVELESKAAGANFTVTSELSHATPLKAVNECLDRALAVLKNHMK